ncbi:hypothetical protein [Methylobacterium sp. WL64]|uniref:hypothetical protein n=1 Tax=Methylobacterium sp. WL64 TaxID=2603894 RepID=UPI001FEE72B7|nr:hypothetical protein [Methylobacterium sp. WL64]
MRYRYYVSRRLITAAAGADRDKPHDVSEADVTIAAAGDGPKLAGQRVPAAKLEAVVTERLRVLLTDASALQDLARGRSAPEQHAMVVAATRLAAEWPKLAQPQQRRLLQAVLTRIDVHAGRIEIAIDSAALLHRLGLDKQEETDGLTAAELPLRLAVSVGLKRVGMEMRLMLPGEAAGPDPDASLGRLLGRAHRIRQRLTGDTPMLIDEVARAEGLTRSYTTRLLRLSYLAPDITARLIAGNHPPELNAARLMRDTRLPLDWAEQRASLAMT